MTNLFSRGLGALSLCLLTASIAWSQESDAATKKKEKKDLPLEAAREIKFETDKVTWMSVDVSPDGQTIAFDMMGDLYTLPITGGTATALTHGLAYDVHPRFSPDGKSVLYISDKSGSDNIWIMNLETKEETKLTDAKNKNIFSADWSPDGEYVVGAEGRRKITLVPQRRRRRYSTH